DYHMSTLADNAMLVVRALTHGKKDGLSFYELQQATRIAAEYLPGILHMLEQQGWWFPRSSMALSRRSGFGTCANKLKRPLDFDTSLFQNGDGDGGARPRSRLKCRGGAARPVAASPLRALARLAIAYSRVDRPDPFGSADRETHCGGNQEIGQGDPGGGASR